MYPSSSWRDGVLNAKKRARCFFVSIICISHLRKGTESRPRAALHLPTLIESEGWTRLASGAVDAQDFVDSIVRIF